MENPIEKNPQEKDLPAKSSGWKMPSFVRNWLRVLDTCTSSLFGGPKCIKYAHIINFQKGATLFVCLAMMRQTNNYTPTATVYTALHGGYGLCWLLKDRIFPDAKWEPKITIGSAVASFAAVLGPYWVIAYNTIGRRSERSNTSLCGAIIVYTIGLFLMTGADVQKHFVLKKEKGLITDGFFARIRHPNYLGEMMLYGAFAYVSNHASSWLILGCVWTGVFIPFMLRKEESMSRYSGWTAYKARSGFLLPHIFPLSEERAQKKQ